MERRTPQSTNCVVALPIYFYILLVASSWEKEDKTFVYLFISFFIWSGSLNQESSGGREYDWKIFSCIFWNLSKRLVGDWRVENQTSAVYLSCSLIDVHSDVSLLPCLLFHVRERCRLGTSLDWLHNRTCLPAGLFFFFSLIHSLFLIRREIFPPSPSLRSLSSSCIYHWKKKKSIHSYKCIHLSGWRPINIPHVLFLSLLYHSLGISGYCCCCCCRPCSPVGLGKLSSHPKYRKYHNTYQLDSEYINK